MTPGGAGRGIGTGRCAVGASLPTGSVPEDAVFRRTTFTSTVAAAVARKTANVAKRLILATVARIACALLPGQTAYEACRDHSPPPSYRSTVNVVAS